MNAYLISIGDELLIGQTVNTNAAFIGELLSENNISVIKITVIGDEKTAILNELKNASSISDLIILTGGLGPTHDDITRACIVEYFKTKLVENAEILENIKTIFGKRNRKLTEINKQQALVPEIAVPIKNNLGTAPGMWIEKEQKIFVVMPGVPSEMKAMMTGFVIPELVKKTKDESKVIKKSVLLTTGIPESALSEKLGDLDELLKGARLAFLPSLFEVKLRITIETDNEEDAKNRLTEIEQKIRAKVGRYIYGKGKESLEEVVGRLLRERGMKISTAESCTGGLIASTLTNISGSSDYFERGIVSYSNASKVEILKVNEDTIAEFGAVSKEVAMQMADGVRSTSGTDIGVSVTGIMGPTGATTDKPVGLVYIGYCDDKLCTYKKYIFGNDRLLNKQRTMKAALDLVRRQVLGISIDD